MIAPPTLLDLRSALGGHVVGGQLLCPGPGHSRRDRSLAVRPSDTSRFGFLVTSYAGDDWRDCQDYVCERLGIDTEEPAREASPVERMQARARRALAEKAEADDLARRIAKANAIWSGAVEPAGTIVERYLVSRGLRLFDGIGEALRFHPACPWEGGTRPAMVCAMRDVLTGELRAVHRTALTGSGEKIDRKMLGPSGGCAIMLDPLGPDLAVGEGVETAMTARQLGPVPAWALGSAHEIGRLPVLEPVQRLVILEENDASGTNARAVLACGTRWQDAGRSVSTIRPPAGCSDLNDMIRSDAR